MKREWIGGGGGKKKNTQSWVLTWNFPSVNLYLDYWFIVTFDIFVGII